MWFERSRTERKRRKAVAISRAFDRRKRVCGRVCVRVVCASGQWRASARGVRTWRVRSGMPMVDDETRVYVCVCRDVTVNDSI